MILGFIGTTELLLIGGLALLLVGGKKLPEMMRGLGKGVREFKEGMNDINTIKPDSESISDDNAAEQEYKEADETNSEHNRIENEPQNDTE